MLSSGAATHNLKLDAAGRLTRLTQALDDTDPAAPRRGSVSWPSINLCAPNRARRSPEPQRQHDRQQAQPWNSQDKVSLAQAPALGAPAKLPQREKAYSRSRVNPTSCSLPAPMSQKTSKPRKKSPGVAGTRTGHGRQERRFATLSSFIATPIALIGMLGSLLLGAGCFGLWILDPAVTWATYVIAVGGLGLGTALWFSAPEETAVLVGDAGIAVEDGRDIARVHWHNVQSISVRRGVVVVEGKSGKGVSFLLGANPKGSAFAFQEALERIPEAFNVDKHVAEKLPKPDPKAGQLESVSDDQVAGTRCAASDRQILLEEDARACPRCGQIYHKDELPETCVSCSADLKGRVLFA
jgi:hypothetical protein